jgi:hypothetical protein
LRVNFGSTNLEEHRCYQPSPPSGNFRAYAVQQHFELLGRHILADSSISATTNPSNLCDSPHSTFYHFLSNLRMQSCMLDCVHACLEVPVSKSCLSGPSDQWNRCSDGHSGRRSLGQYFACCKGFGAHLYISSSLFLQGLWWRQRALREWWCFRYSCQVGQILVMKCKFSPRL